MENKEELKDVVPDASKILTHNDDPSKHLTCDDDPNKHLTYNGFPLKYPHWNWDTEYVDFKFPPISDEERKRLEGLKCPPIGEPIIHYCISDEMTKKINEEFAKNKGDQDANGQ